MFICPINISISVDDHKILSLDINLSCDSTFFIGWTYIFLISEWQKKKFEGEITENIFIFLTHWTEILILKKNIFLNRFNVQINQFFFSGFES